MSEQDKSKEEPEVTAEIARLEKARKTTGDTGILRAIDARIAELRGGNPSSLRRRRTDAV
jgi:hypothetical protein